MPILPFRPVKVADDMIVRLSNYFFYTDFGIRFNGVQQQKYGRRYVCTGTPGTGFIERESESHSYRDFVRNTFRSQKANYWKLFLNKQPSFDNEIKKARRALDETSDPLKHRILDSYINALTVAADEERIERIQRAIKDKMGHRHHNKFYVSVLSHYKHKVSQLEKDMLSVELNIKNICTAEQYAAYKEMVEAFIEMAACRRTWNNGIQGHNKYEQVFFDLGVFDFIFSETFLPIIRTAEGVTYYLLPTHMLVVRSTTDFDVVPLKEVTVVCQEMAIQESIEALNSSLGDAASMMRMPGFNQTWYFNHVRAIVAFVAAYDKLKSLQ